MSFNFQVTSSSSSSHHSSSHNGQDNMKQPLMGNRRLYATTDKPYYVPGELVTGTIIADLSAPVSARGIDLTISGFEKVEWHEVSMESKRPNGFDSADGGAAGPPQQVQRVHRHRGRKEFFCTKQRIFEISGGMMMPGQHRFPFQYQLPEGLPGSFLERQPMPHLQPDAEFEDDDMYANNFYDSDDETDGVRRGPQGYKRAGLLAMVMYKLKVTLDVNGFFHPDMHARIPLIVHPKLSAGLTPAVSQLSSNVTVCCCLNKGTATVVAQFDKTAYTRGETAQITADVDNQSTQTLTMVVKLHRTIELHSGQRKFRGQKIDREVVAQQKYEAVLPMTKIVRAMPLPLNSDAIKPCTEGEYVKCSYQYTVECQISMGSDIVLKMPVVIYAPQPRPLMIMQQQPMSPQQMMPQQMMPQQMPQQMMPQQ